MWNPGGLSTRSEQIQNERNNFLTWIPFFNGMTKQDSTLSTGRPARAVASLLVMPFRGISPGWNDGYFRMSIKVVMLVRTVRTTRLNKSLRIGLSWSGEAPPPISCGTSLRSRVYFKDKDVFGFFGIGV